MASQKHHGHNLRKGRHSQPGYFYFLTTSVAGRRQIFTNHDHSIVVLDALRWLHTTGRFSIDAAVVMPDHLHFVGQLRNSTLVKIMHTLKSYSAKRFARSGIKPPIWEEGYYDHALRDDEDYRAKVQYVVQNPVRAGLVERVEDYPSVILPDWWGGVD